MVVQLILKSILNKTVRKKNIANLSPVYITLATEANGTIPL